MTVLDALVKGRTKSKPADPEKPRDLAELLPARDPIVATLQAEEDAVIPQRDRAKVELEQLISRHTDADAVLRSQRLLRAAGSGSDEAVDRAKRERDRLADLVEDHRDLVQALGNKIAAAREDTRKAQVEAIKRAYAAGIAEARTEVIERDQIHESLIPHVARSRAIHQFLETVSAEAKRLEVPGCALSPQASLVLNGSNPGSNAAAWLTILLVPDPNTPRGGGLGLWRHAAIEAGLMEPTGATKADRDRESQRKADDMVRASLAEEWDRDHLKKVWGDVDRRDYSMKD